MRLRAGFLTLRDQGLTEGSFLYPSPKLEKPLACRLIKTISQLKSVLEQQQSIYDTRETQNRIAENNYSRHTSSIPEEDENPEVYPDEMTLEILKEERKAEELERLRQEEAEEEAQIEEQKQMIERELLRSDWELGFEGIFLIADALKPIPKPLPLMIPRRRRAHYHPRRL